jgi:4-amino-4-deoxy-L-arabinose transferase-like glycosyltransferase
MVAALVMFAIAMSAIPQLPILGDPVSYHMTAQRLVERGEYSYTGEQPGVDIAPNAAVTPGYPVFLAGIYLATGHASGEPTSTAVAVQPAVNGLQFLLALCTVGLIASCGLLLGGRRLALLAGFMAALYVPFVWSSVVALGETVATTLAALQLLLALWIADKRAVRGWWLLVAFGLVSASLVMIRPVMILWIPVPLLYIAVRRMESPKRLLALTALTLAGVLVVMAPWWARNALDFHRLTPLADNSGIVLLLSTGGTELTPAEQVISDAADAQGRDGLTAVAQSRIQAQFRADPVGFLAARAKNTAYAVRNPWSPQVDIIWALQNTPDIQQISMGPLPDADLDALGRWLEFTGVYHELLVLLALGALALMWRSRRLFIVASVPAYVIAVYSTTLFIDRYFLPSMPAVVLMAAASVFWVGAKTWSLSATYRRGAGAQRALRRATR